MRIQHNIGALNTSNQLKKAQTAQNKNLAKLSSGYSINKAADNAAGLAISEKMRGQIRGMEQASKNATDGVNLIQTAEGYMSTANDILQRMRELAVQAANGTYDTSDPSANQTAINQVDGGAANGGNKLTGDRAKINEEIQQLTDELDRLSKVANFNGMKLNKQTFAFQVGANTKTEYTTSARYGSSVTTADLTQTSVQGNTGTGFKNITANSTTTGKTMGTKNAEFISVSIGGFDATSLGVNTSAKSANGIDLTSQASANLAIDKINKAISKVTADRAKLGAVQNRLEYTIDNLDVAIENTTSSESAIRDTDMVSEMMNYTKNNVLNQAATAMMAQANTSTQSVLQLLG